MRSEKLAEENSGGGGGVVGGGGGGEEGDKDSFPNTRTRRSPPCHLCWILTRAFTRQFALVSHNATCVTQELLSRSCLMSHIFCDIVAFAL